MLRPWRRLRRRIPVSVRLHWKLLALCCAFLAVLGLGYDVGVQPLVTSDSAEGDVVTENIEGTVDVFDETVAHTVVVTYSQDDYDRMLEEYYDEGEKDWIEADLVIDGTAVDSVGIRLKGNSTLMGLSQSGQSGEDGRGGFGGGDMPTDMPTDITGLGGDQMPTDMPTDMSGLGGGEQSEGDQSQDQAQDMGAIGGGGMGGMGGMMSSVSADEPESLPWLISFDEYVEGRRYQGYQTISVRAAGSSGVALNEAVSLSVIDTMDEPSAQFSYTSFTVNDQPTTARLLVEDFGNSFADELGSNGVLFKALSSASFSYQGEDQTEYEDDFKQINLIGSQDVQPVIDFLKWIDEASDEEFVANLDQYVDVESFARYVALQNLLLNYDDMAGPGKNYYLWYDLDTERLTVITSDLNLTFSGTATQGPYDDTTMGGGGGGFGDGGQTQGGTQGEDQGQGFQMPDTDSGAAGMPEGMELPEGVDLSELGGDDAGGFGGMMSGNTLKERFLELEAFHSVYEDAYRELYQGIFGSGLAADAVTSIAETLRTVDGVDSSIVDSELTSLLSTIESRTSSLATNEVITSAW